MAHPDWNERYGSGEPLPWDAGVPDPMLVELVQSGALPRGGKAIDIGCGTGTNVIWLAQQGFDVLGVDIAPLAVEQARKKAGGAARVRFAVHDILAGAPEGGPFQLVFDRGCFHVFDEAAERAKFATRVASILASGGRWLSLIGSTEGAARDSGPPRRSVRDIAAAMEPELELLTLSSAQFELDPPVKAWVCITGRREVPAQPSSRRG
jgi:SAM-dependent methyltransferase